MGNRPPGFPDPPGCFSGKWRFVSQGSRIIRNEISCLICFSQDQRNFKDKPVERHKLEKLLEIACFAPSAKHSQPWHWTVIEAPTDVRRLAAMVIDWMHSVR